MITEIVGSQLDVPSQLIEQLADQVILGKKSHRCARGELHNRLAYQLDVFSLTLEAKLVSSLQTCPEQKRRKELEDTLKQLREDRAYDED